MWRYECENCGYHSEAIGDHMVQLSQSCPSCDGFIFIHGGVSSFQNEEEKKGDIMYCRICEIKIEEGNVCENCIARAINTKEVILSRYKPDRCSYTAMRSHGNSDDVFQDGEQSGEHYTYYHLGIMLGMELPEPEEPDYEDMW